MRQRLVQKSQNGSTGVGMMVGLILGLLVAVMVAIFVTKAPVPWVAKVTKSGDGKAIEAKSGTDAPDPNKPLYGKNSKAGEAAPSAEKTAEAASGDNKDSILGLLGSLGKENLPAAKDPAAKDPAVKEPSAKEPAAKISESRPSDTKNEPKPEAKAETDSTRYMLQAGAFRERDDADSMKGKLALLGFEARISTVERDGNTIYRVRTGPFKVLDEASTVRKRLADGGIETSLVPIRQ